MKRRQKAVTAKFLKKLIRVSGLLDPELTDTAQAIAAEMIVAAWFFAMRGCEYSHSPRAGKTKPICAVDVVFRTKDRRTIKHQTKRTHRAEYVTITFKNQKNGKMFDSRTQRRTGHKLLCPVLRWSSLITRQRQMKLSPQKPIFRIRTAGKIQFINMKYVRNLLRTTCEIFGGKDEFGFDPSEIGSKSVRSGAAMALFLADVSVAKIMILGRWSSDAFLDYIRPQVLEWTGSMSRDMTKMHNFIDVGLTRSHTPADPRARKQLKSFNGSSFLLPQFDTFH
jgi:hypothetical protein